MHRKKEESIKFVVNYACTESRAEKERMVIEVNISSTRQDSMKKVSGNKRIRRKV